MKDLLLYLHRILLEQFPTLRLIRNLILIIINLLSKLYESIMEPCFLDTVKMDKNQTYSDLGLGVLQTDFLSFILYTHNVILSWELMNDQL